MHDVQTLFNAHLLGKAGRGKWAPSSFPQPLREPKQSQHGWLDGIFISPAAQEGSEKPK